MYRLNLRDEYEDPRLSAEEASPELNLEVVFRGDDARRVLDACDRLGYITLGAGVAGLALAAISALGQ